MGVEPENEFISDDELKSLLERWNAPGPSGVLDKRIATSFAREFSGADGLSQSVLLPHRREEVVSMKFCSRCEEEFADKFSFCPVDGTPLTPVSARVPAAAQVEDPSLTVSHDNDPSVTRAQGDQGPQGATPDGWTNEPVNEPVYAAAGAGAMIQREEYHLTIMNDAGLVSRLSHELSDVAHEYQLTWPEFKRDPFGFTKRTFVGYGNMFVKFLRKPNVLLAMGAAFLGMLALVGAVMLMDRSSSSTSSRAGLVVFAVIAGGLLIALFSTWLGRERGAAVMGAGTIGLLATLALRLRGLQVTTFGLNPKPYLNSDLIEAIGATYQSTKELPILEGAKKYGPFDIIFEATGFSPVVFESMRALGKNGVLVLSSVTGGDRRIEVPADKINLEFVLGNKVMVGTVNANREYFEMGVKDLAQAEAEYPGWLSRLLTHPVKGLENYRELFDKLLNPNGAIKVFCEVASV